MRFNLFRELAQEPPNYRDWKPWFAWYPVIFDRRLVWLETVERSPSGLYPPSIILRPHYYRLLPRP